MEISNEFGKFTIRAQGNTFTVDAWQGETKQFNVKYIPVSEIADCLNWLSESEIEILKKMIGARRYLRARKFAKKMYWID